MSALPCPECETKLGVVETRLTKKREVYRRRVCPKCNAKVSTYEIDEPTYARLKLSHAREQARSKTIEERDIERLPKAVELLNRISFITPTNYKQKQLLEEVEIFLAAKR